MYIFVYLCSGLPHEQKKKPHNRSTKGLSKSRYTTFCQCPKNLWLKVYKPDLTYTRKSCHFRSQKESDNEAQDKNRARV